MPIRKSSVSGSGGNNFVLSVGSSGDTTYVLGQAYPAGSYNISTNSDTTYDIYAIASDGTSAGYSNSPKIEVSAAFTELVVLGAAAGEIFTFEYAGTVTAPSSKGDVASAGAFITSVSVSSLPNADDTTTITGGNFAADVQVFFTGQDSVEIEAKALTRNSSTELVATRPDALDATDSPYTVKVVNPGVTEPTGSSAHLLANSITAGANPSWVTAAAQEYDPLSAVSTTLSATDADGTVSYSLQSGTLPGGLSLNGSTGEISGTPTTSDGDVNVFTIRATDEGGNFVDREFTFTAALPPLEATGGTVTDSGGYRYHTFTSSGTFELLSNPANINVEFLRIAGGASGGHWKAGGGGAGGVLFDAVVSATPGQYAVAVGAGGPGVTGDDATPGANGNNSTVTTLNDAIGGGGGGEDSGNDGGPGLNGGSGGGGSRGQSGGLGVSGQGSNGGSGSASAPYVGGGGGGAGGAGGNGTGGSPGVGGQGTSLYSAWGIATGTGENVSGTVYYAGGGGAVGYGLQTSATSSGGFGGGSDGSYSGNNDAQVNTGGGGGGADNYENTAPSGSGGSGVVIVRYAI